MLSKMIINLDDADDGLCNAEYLKSISVNDFLAHHFSIRLTVAASIVWSSHPGIFNETRRPWSLNPTVMRAKAKVSHSAISKLGPRLSSVGNPGNIAYPFVSLGEERIDIRRELINRRLRSKI